LTAPLIIILETVEDEKTWIIGIFLQMSD